MLIRVPATSANLGPGFDSFGIAWQIYNEISFELSEKTSISGCEERFCNEENLALRAFRAACERKQVPAPAVSIRFGRTEIPVSRGLGSSASLIAAGVTAANALCSLHMSDAELLAAATALEGHPDNVSPALFGGFTASLLDSSGALTAQFPLSEKLHFAVLVPPFELSTEKARGVLPPSYSRADAVFNISHAALMLSALASGDAALLSRAMCDRIHEPYRRALIPGFDAAERCAKECGAAAVCISGAGSTMLCISDRAEFAEALSEALPALLPGWRVIAAQNEHTGAAILEE